jgi:hypothetical protein
MEPLHLRFRCKISTHLQTVPLQEPTDSHCSYANYMLITMGAYKKSFEQVIPPNGIVDVDHTFHQLSDKDSFYNHLEFDREYYDRLDIKDEMSKSGVTYSLDAQDTLIKSHAIIWIYKRRYEDRKHPGRFVPGDLHNIPDDKKSRNVMRSYHIASASINLLPLMIAADTSKGTNNPEFKIMNNFSSSYASCMILPHGETSPNKFLLDQQIEGQSVSSDTFNMYTGLQAFDKRKSDTINQGLECISSVDLKYERSSLQELPLLNRLVTTQQMIVKTQVSGQCSDGKVTLSDKLAAMFVPGSTYLQMYGAGVCFTDMTSIIKHRLPEYPVHLLMVHAYTAFNLNCTDMEQFIQLRTPSCANELAAAFKTILTAELIDPKQTEYYSDYNLYGVETVSKEEFDVSSQPIRGYHKENRLNETWFYEMRGTDDKPEYLRYILTMTEDQRQVCTGEGLQSQLVGDDCESGSNYEVGTNKTWDIISFSMKRDGVFAKLQEYHKKLDSMSTSKAVPAIPKISPTNSDTIQRAAEYNALLQSVDEVTLNRYMNHQSLCKLNDTRKREIFWGTANVLSQIDRNMKLVVGSAGAASAGGERHMGGHCYSMLETKHVDSDVITRHVIEATNWISQKEKGDEHEPPISSDEYKSINAIATLLAMASKNSTSTNVDHSRCAMQTGRYSQNDFYVHVFMLGDSYVFQKHDTIPRVLQFGAEISKLVRDEGIVLIPCSYGLVETEIRKRGLPVKEGAVSESVHTLAREEAVPSWSRNKWNSITDNFVPCQDIYPAPGDQTVHHQPKPSQTVRKDGRLRHRFVFAQQHYDQMTDEDVSAYVVAFQKLLAYKGTDGNDDDSAVEGTMLMYSKCKATPDGVSHTAYEKHLASNPLFDIKESNVALRNIGEYIKHEKTFTTMSSLVTVCSVHPDDINLVRDKLKSWVKPMVHTWTQRAKFVKKWNISVLAKHEQWTKA